jgi:pimeloyl-ACP methyl ester carboxylesterase
MPTQTKPSIVFAHGLWADGSCFSKVIPALQADGHEVVAAQNSLDTLEGDVAAVKRALGRVNSPAILVGHSYGGTVITAAGADKRVAGLVYIAALAPDEDETSQSLINKFPTTPVFSHIEGKDAYGCARMASAILQVIYPRKSSRLSGRPKVYRRRTFSIRRWPARPGNRNRAGTSWQRTTKPFSRNWNASAQSA